MKKYLLSILTFLFSVFLIQPLLAQGNGNSDGNNGGNKYKIEGKQLPCAGEIETYKISPNPKSNAVVWEWEWDGPRAGAGVPPPGWEIISYSADRSEMKVRVGEKPGTIKCKPDPGANNTENLPVHPVHGMKLSVQGPTEVCVNQLQIFKVNIGNLNKGKKNNKDITPEDLTIAWELPTGLTVVSGQNTSTLTVMPTASFTGGTVSVSVSIAGGENEPTNNGNGVGRVTGFCMESEKASLTVGLSASCGTIPPGCLTPQVNITGPATVCPSQTEAVTFSAGVANATPDMTYLWNVPEGWQLKSGQGTSSIQVLVGDTPGQVGLAVTNNCNKTATDVQVVTFRDNCGTTPPDCAAPQVSVVGPDEVCAFADEPVTFTADVTNASGDLEYIWTVPADWFIIAGETTNTIEVIVGFESGSVGVTVTNNACGKSATNEKSVLTLEDCSPLEPLPVELISFTGESTKNGVLLQWSTATEKNNDRFELERSQDGETFTKIGQVKGNGTTNSRHNYSLRDNQAGKGTHYYRLKQMDLNGDYEFSKVIAVNHSQGVAVTSLVVAPNPVAGGQFTIRLPEAAANAQVQILDMNGRLLITQNLDAGSYEASFSTQTLNMRPGMYLIKLKDGEKVSHAKMIVK
jgi:hypothetical protein